MRQWFWNYRTVGIFGGVMLVLGQFWPGLCVLQLAALVPLTIYAVKTAKPSLCAQAGFYMGLAFVLPQMVYLRMPLVVNIILLLWFTLLLTLLCWGTGLLLRLPPVTASLGVGALWVLIDWLNYTAVPIWGAAQSFARSWSAYPAAIGFVSFTGISSVLFFSGTLQVLTANILVNRSKKTVFIALFILLAAAAILNFIAQPPAPVGNVTVAAIGWPGEEPNLDPHTKDGFEHLFATPLRQAAVEGAQLVVSGELGFYFADFEREQWLGRFGSLAREYNIWLIVGYYNITAEENRLFFMSPAGQIVDEYTKTYLTPAEEGNRGTGQVKTIRIDGIQVGGLICHDDNYYRLLRKHAMAGTNLIACPTFDWTTVRKGHLQAIRDRAIEFQIPIVRAASAGVSAIISANGQILAKSDHHLHGPGFIIANVPLLDTTTPFTRHGRIPMVVMITVIALLTACTFYRTKPKTCSATKAAEVEYVDGFDGRI